MMDKLKYPEVIEQYIAQEKENGLEIIQVKPLKLDYGNCTCYEVTSVCLSMVKVWKYYHHPDNDKDFAESATIFRDEIEAISKRMNELMQEALEKDKEELEKTA